MKLRVPAVLFFAFGALVLPAPAEAAACSGTSGVTVVVQFPDHTEVRCAPGDPTSGYDALYSAGFSLTYATGSGAGAICQIDGIPDHPCPSMPSASAYWAYFHAKPGGTWSYSTTGGGGYDPKPGTVEGWRFGSGSAPSTSPPGTAGTPTSTPTPKPTSTPTPKPSGTPVVQPVETRPPDAGTTPTATNRTPGAGTSAPATDDSTPSIGGSLVAGTSPTAAALARVNSGTSSHGAKKASGGASWIWGVALLGVLGAAGGATALRRRRG